MGYPKRDPNFNNYPPEDQGIRIALAFAMVFHMRSDPTKSPYEVPPNPVSRISLDTGMQFFWNAFLSYHREQVPSLRVWVGFGTWTPLRCLRFMGSYGWGYKALNMGSHFCYRQTMNIGYHFCYRHGVTRPLVLLMDKVLHDPKDPKLWELWYISYNG